MSIIDKISSTVIKPSNQSNKNKQDANFVSILDDKFSDTNNPTPKVGSNTKIDSLVTCVTPIKYANNVSKSTSNSTQYIKEPRRSDFANIEDFYKADNEYIQQLLANPHAIPEIATDSNYKLTRPEKGISRSTDVYSRVVEDNMLKYLGNDGNVVWQIFVPNLNWQKVSDGKNDSAVGDVYSRNTSRYSAEVVFKRGSEIGEPKPILKGEVYDGGKAYKEFQKNLITLYGQLFAMFDLEGNIVNKM